MGKMIIDNQSSADDIDALDMVQIVIAGGRISNNDKQYCYYTTMSYGGGRYGVATDLNKQSDRFVVVDDKNPR